LGSVQQSKAGGVHVSGRIGTLADATPANQGAGEGLLGDVFGARGVSPAQAESADQPPIVGLVAIDKIGCREDAFGDLSARIGPVRLHHSHGDTVISCDGPATACWRSSRT